DPLIAACGYIFFCFFLDRYNNLQKKQERAVLSMELPLPVPGMTAAVPLAEPRQNVPEPEHPSPFVFVSPPDLSGQALRRGQQPIHEHLQYLGSAPQPATLDYPAPAPPLPHPTPAPPLPLHSTPPPCHLPHLQPTNDPEGKVWSRSTLWRRRKAAEALARQQGLPIPPRVTHTQYMCAQCGKPRTRQFGHSRMGNKFFCSTAEGKTVEEWQAEQRR
ncbi:hypothetical protein MHYP_G00366460, partial [Metynnis hypsauchen]